MNAPRYRRAPSDGFLHAVPRVLLTRRPVSGVPVDPHLREGDGLSLYVGTTAVLSLFRAGARWNVVAHRSYATVGVGPSLFRQGKGLGDYIEASWEADDPAFVPTAEAYLAAVRVEPRWIANEGAVQSGWAAVGDPFVQLDREAQLGYPSRVSQREGRAFEAVRAAREQVAARGWATLPSDRVSAKLDRLALDGNRLVLIELKDGAGADGVYYAPLQLLQYAWEWHEALPIVRDGLERLRRARVELGLMEDVPLGEGIRPIVAIGAARPSTEVRARFNQVQMIVNDHLPPGCPPIEMWALDEGKAVLVG